jgi:hypothetical protein
LQVFCGIFSNDCLFPLESDEEYFDAEDGDSHTAKSIKGSELKKAAEVPNEELINFLLKFEIKEVCVCFVHKYILDTVFCMMLG